MPPRATPPEVFAALAAERGLRLEPAELEELRAAYDALPLLLDRLRRKAREKGADMLPVVNVVWAP
ncbi:MAG: hypothetical protein EXQ96_09390 [Alphaproteobacteria bacterium]|nr:hypothetical protein [Alphaproteobacteria bacterium]